MKKTVSILLVLAILLSFPFAQGNNVWINSAVAIAEKGIKVDVSDTLKPLPATEGAISSTSKNYTKMEQAPKEWWEGRFVGDLSAEELNSFFYVETIANGFISRYNEMAGITEPILQTIDSQKLRLLGRHENGNEYLYIDDEEKIEIYFKLDENENLKLVELTFKTEGGISERTWMKTDPEKTTAIISSALYGCGMEKGEAKKVANKLMIDYAHSRDKSATRSKIGFTSKLEFLDFGKFPLLYLSIRIY